MPRLLHVAFSLLVVSVMVAGPWWYKRHHERHFRSLHVVQDGVLYRSGQVDLDGLKTIVRDYRIKTIISLRDGYSPFEQDEVDWSPYAGITHSRIPQREWQDENGGVPAEQGLEEFRKIMRDPVNHPVLIHCFAGIHRTGAYCAIYRMDFQGWSNADAIAEMRALGYTTLDGDRDILGYLERYKPRCNVQVGDLILRAPRHIPPAVQFPLSKELQALEKAAEDHGRPWKVDQPSHLTPDRVHGGIGP